MKIIFYVVQFSGAVASLLAHSFPDGADWVQTLADDILLCSWARLLTLTVPLYSQDRGQVN